MDAWRACPFAGGGEEIRRPIRLIVLTAKPGRAGGNYAMIPESPASLLSTP